MVIKGISIQKSLEFIKCQRMAVFEWNWLRHKVLIQFLVQMESEFFIKRVGIYSEV